MGYLPQQALENATSVDGVLGAVRIFLRALGTAGLDRLPRYYRPAGVESALAVELWAEQLERYELKASQDPVNSALFVEVRDFFVRAKSRLSEVESVKEETAP
jgi:hypothetical protein